MDTVWSWIVAHWQICWIGAGLVVAGRLILYRSFIAHIVAALPPWVVLSAAVIITVFWPGALALVWCINCKKADLPWTARPSKPRGRQTGRQQFFERPRDPPAA